MKKLLFVAICIFVLGCNPLEELKYVGKCMTCTVTVSYGSYGSASSSTQVCGTDIAKINGKTTTAKGTYAGHSVTITTKTTCK
jgi:hypothetical protein